MIIFFIQGLQTGLGVLYQKYCRTLNAYLSKQEYLIDVCGVFKSSPVVLGAC